MITLEYLGARDKFLSLPIASRRIVTSFNNGAFKEVEGKIRLRDQLKEKSRSKV